jgi:hypothetical protein
LKRCESSAPKLNYENRLGIFDYMGQKIIFELREELIRYGRI